jgi:hypothetical protein
MICRPSRAWDILAWFPDPRLAPWATLCRPLRRAFWKTLVRVPKPDEIWLLSLSRGGKEEQS